MGKIDDMRRLRDASHVGESAAVKGRCSVCGKVRVLDRGLVSSHQKGLGKACPGSLKQPCG
jgi:hypothetical protein